MTEFESDLENEERCTGLPWPKSWPVAYAIVLASFILWVGLLITLTESFS